MLKKYFLSVMYFFYPRRDMTRQGRESTGGQTIQIYRELVFTSFLPLPSSATQAFDQLDWHSFDVNSCSRMIFPGIGIIGRVCPPLLMCQTRLQLSTFFRVHSSQRTAATTCRDRQMFKWSIPRNLQIFAWQCKGFFCITDLFLCEM